MVIHTAVLLVNVSFFLVHQLLAGATEAAGVYIVVLRCMHTTQPLSVRRLAGHLINTWCTP